MGKSDGGCCAREVISVDATTTMARTLNTNIPLISNYQHGNTPDQPGRDNTQNQAQEG